MKTSAITLQMVMLLLFVAITTYGVAGQKEPVRDVLGNPVTTRLSYYARFDALSALISRSSTEMGVPCPQSPILSMIPQVLLPFQPIVFVSSSDDVVRVSTELNIKFLSPDPCLQSGFWRVPEKANDMVLLTGSKAGNDSAFFIQKSTGSRYKFAMGSADPAQSTYIGLRQERFGVMRLISGSNITLEVSFIPFVPV